MLKGNHHLVGNYKQQLMRSNKKPPKEAIERIESWLWDNEVLRVFVDTSKIENQGIFGLGVIYVGQGLTSVKYKKHYNQAMKKVNVYGELIAVEFALTQVGKIIEKEFNQPSMILIYSDWNEISKLEDPAMITKRILAINDVAERINERKSEMSISYPDTDLEILYMRDEEKRFNPFYKGAHNAARKAIGI
ncbi:hypothetical protein ABDH65_05230 [Heyndrickxia ginsengihumi]|uniref:hypothetical protein n=1 Tax=Heyndrickxia ginsengihumi TaxID=363870 RepID=UPI003D2133F7